MNAYQDLLLAYIADPNNAWTNWEMGDYYDTIGQKASAVSFYLRTAERTDDSLLQYTCLLRSALCFEHQGSRNFTVRGLLQHAVAIRPDRPEGYFLLSRHYEREKYDGHWNDCYTIASIGEKVTQHQSIQQPLHADVEYPIGNYGLLFERAVSSWWCGLCDESRELFTDLYLNYPLDTAHYIAVHGNLQFLKSPYGQYRPFTIYRNYDQNRLRIKFGHYDTVVRNYSEAFQDLFVLTMFDGKHTGTYLEIGAGDPVYGNNTYLLEQKFGWTGTAIDYNADLSAAYNRKRGDSNQCITADATEFDYTDIGPYIDYLQIDCDPPEVSYQALQRIDFDKTDFGVITFEHDLYADTSKLIKYLASDYLESKGYIRIVENISPDGVRAYEDWWVNPKHIDAQRIKKFKKLVDSASITKSDILNAQHIFLKEI